MSLSCIAFAVLVGLVVIIGIVGVITLALTIFERCRLYNTRHVYLHKFDNADSCEFDDAMQYLKLTNGISQE